IKEQVEKFKMIYEFIELDREYLDELESTRINYNPNVPMFDASYKLKSNDENIDRIKELYPNLDVDENECELELHGSAEPWATNGWISMEISLEEIEGDYLLGMMSFGRTGYTGEEEKNE
ncbi:MAG: Csa1 family protein, partial [Sarcina sp.]